MRREVTVLARLGGGVGVVIEKGRRAHHLGLRREWAVHCVCVVCVYVLTKECQLPFLAKNSDPRGWKLLTC